MSLDSSLAQKVAQAISDKIKQSTNSTKPEENWKIAVDEIFKAIKENAELDVTIDPVTVQGVPTDSVVLSATAPGLPVAGIVSPPTNPVKGKGKVK